jgi:hypothetical protein
VGTLYCGNFVLWELCIVGTLYCGNFVLWELCIVGTLYCGNFVGSGIVGTFWAVG